MPDRPNVVVFEEEQKQIQRICDELLTATGASAVLLINQMSRKSRVPDSPRSSHR